MKDKLQVYIGTFSTNLYSLKFDPETLEIEDLHAIHDPGGRSAYLALDEEEKYLYVANEWMDGDGGLHAFRLNADGDPVYLNSIPAGTQGPAQLSTMKAYGKTFVLGAGLFEGDVMVCPTADDGSLLPMSHNFYIYDFRTEEQLAGTEKFIKAGDMTVSGRGRAHGVKPVPGTNLVIIPDTLNGELYTFELTPEGKLELKSVFSSPDFNCPRHMTFSKDGTKLYFLTERTSTLDAFDINRETGELTLVYHSSTLPDDYTGENMSSAIHRSPDGRFVYLSNRGYDSIAVFRIDKPEIERVAIVSGEIAWPREFLITPDGEFMLVGNQEIHTVSIFRINHETGIPEYTGKTFDMPEPGPASLISIPKTDD